MKTSAPDCYATFTPDLEYGADAEGVICLGMLREATQRLLDTARKSPQAGLDFTLLGLRVEVKCDRQGAKTGNFALEIQVNGRPGLLTYTMPPDLVAYAFDYGDHLEVYWMRWHALVRVTGVKALHMLPKPLRAGDTWDHWRVIAPLGDKRGAVLLVPRKDIEQSGIVIERWRIRRERG